MMEDIWIESDFPDLCQGEYPITPAQYHSLKQRWLGQKVKPRDPRVTDAVLLSWGMKSWKEYVLDKYLGNF